MASGLTIHEIQMPIEVETPMGRGIIWLIKDYGIEMNTFYTVIINAGEMAGLVFDFSNSDIKVTKNYSLGRGSWQELRDKITKSSIARANPD